MDGCRFRCWEVGHGWLLIQTLGVGHGGVASVIGGQDMGCVDSINGMEGCMAL